MSKFLKSVDYYINQTHAGSSAAIVLPVNLIELGTDFYQREDNIVHGIGVKCSFVVINNSNTTTLFYRYALVYDRFPGSSIPTALDIFNVTDKSGTTYSPPVSAYDFPQNPRTISRFLVLHDHRDHLNGKNQGQGDFDTIHSFDRAIHGLDTAFSLSSSAITAGALYFVFISKQMGQATDISLNGNLRYIYND